MSESNRADPRQAPNADALSEGGLRAPAHYGRLRKLWWWFDFLILVKLARLRFIAILAVIGAAILYWDTLIAYYEKWTRPLSGAAQAVDPDRRILLPHAPPGRHQRPPREVPHLRHEPVEAQEGRVHRGRGPAAGRRQPAAAIALQGGDRRHPHLGRRLTSP